MQVRSGFWEREVELQLEVSERRLKLSARSREELWYRDEGSLWRDVVVDAVCGKCLIMLKLNRKTKLLVYETPRGFTPSLSMSRLFPPTCTYCLERNPPSQSLLTSNANYYEYTRSNIALAAPSSHRSSVAVHRRALYTRCDCRTRGRRARKAPPRRCLATRAAPADAAADGCGDPVGVMGHLGKRLESRGER